MNLIQNQSEAGGQPSYPLRRPTIAGNSPPSILLSTPVVRRIALDTSQVPWSSRYLSELDVPAYSIYTKAGKQYAHSGYPGLSRSGGSEKENLDTPSGSRTLQGQIERRTFLKSNGLANNDRRSDVSQRLTSRQPVNSDLPSRQIRSRFAEASRRFSLASNIEMTQQINDGLPLVEIPRFKWKSLNLGIVGRRATWRLTWLTLWVIWLLNAIVSLFFDLNIMYMLVQCVQYPMPGASESSWKFAAAAYAICCGVSFIVVWLAWELLYSFWHRWRSDRPAIEPIYWSLPASLHLSLKSYHHFVFLAHIRLSPIGTPYAMDIVPETCYAVIQLLPGLMALLPRAAIAVVLLTSSGHHSAEPQTPLGVDDRISLRDAHFFRSDSYGQLTIYSTGVLYAFTAAVGVRAVLIMTAAIGIGIFASKRGSDIVAITPTTPRHTSDPSRRLPPQRSWYSAENELDWEWRTRTRARIQDAFELCMMRFHPRSPDSNVKPQRTAIQDKVILIDAHGFSDTTASASRSEHVLRPGSVASSGARPESGVIPDESEKTLFVPQDSENSALDSLPERRQTSTTSAVPNARSSPREKPQTEKGNQTALSARLRNVLQRDGSGHDVPHAGDYPVSALRTIDKTLSRARSTSISLLRDKLSNNLVSRARNDTMMSSDNRYARFEDVGELASSEGRRVTR